MDQEKIGKFIAERRKERGMTQLELAEKLGVSDKSIGNWENARCMPDLSLFKPLCDALDVSINDLISGRVVEKENYHSKLEENIINAIAYSNKKVLESKKILGYILLAFGILLAGTAFSVFPSESSWGSLYAILGVIISTIGLSRLTKKFNKKNRILINILYIVILFVLLFAIDTLGVILNHQAPRFSYIKIIKGNMITYKAPFYNVYRVNFDTKMEYYIIDFENRYTEETVPNVPFDRDKSGIDNLIKYKSEYVGDNSNDGHLIDSLPLSEFGYTFEIDGDNFGITINYHITGWYIDDDGYLSKSLVYNTVVLFSLIDNLEYVEYNFNKETYKTTRDVVEDGYPNFKEIVHEDVDKDNFNSYLENKLMDDEFIKMQFLNFFSN